MKSHLQYQQTRTCAVALRLCVAPVSLSLQMTTTPAKGRPDGSV